MSSRGFTLIELLVVLAIVAVLFGLATAVATSTLTHAQSAKCVSNLRQWGVAVQLYVGENNGRLPRRGQGVQPVFRIERPEDWFNSLPPYLGLLPYHDLYQSGQIPQPGDRTVFVCPAATVSNDYTHFICYGMNMYLSRWDQPERTSVAVIPNPSTLAFMADSPGGYASTVPSASASSVVARHGGKANVVFLDGHVRSFPGAYLGCGTGEKTQPDVRWKTGVEGDTWKPNP